MFTTSYSRFLFDSPWFLLASTFNIIRQQFPGCDRIQSELPAAFDFFFLEQLVRTAMEDKVVNGKIKISIIPALEATRVLGETGKKN